MLEEIYLENFRCYRKFTVKFNDFNVIVGRNNSGKSTIIDALKLLSNVQRYGAYREDLVLEPRDLPFSVINIRHDYSNDDATIKARFSGDKEIRIVFPKDERFRIEYYRAGNAVGNKSIIRREFRQTLGIVPPVGTFEEDETIVTEEYLKQFMVSHLSTRHFRNIWLYFPDGFEEFKELLSRTWPGYSISAPEPDTWNNRIHMFFKEGRIDREIFWAGHGLQVWFQLLTHMVKLGRRETLILDEPDIYLHSDMQKKLVEICKERSNQVIIATHAVDIIDEVEPDDVLSIDSNLDNAYRLANVEELQRCIAQLGSTENLKLAHFLKGNTCLFVEGDDIRYLRKLSRTLGFAQFSQGNFSTIPLGGSSNWERLKHISWLFRNAFGQTIKCFVILDRDYQSDEDAQRIVKDLGKQDVIAHVWRRKELENYLIHPDALYRMFVTRFAEKHPSNQVPLTKEEFRSLIDYIVDGLKVTVMSQVLGNKVRDPSKRKQDVSSISKQVIQEFESKWSNPEFRLMVVPGKEFFAILNGELTSKYSTTVSIDYALNSLRKDEIDREVKEVLRGFIELLQS